MRGGLGGVERQRTAFGKALGDDPDAKVEISGVQLRVDPKTGAIRLAGVFPNPANELRPGQYGRVRAVTDTRKGALLVPQRAVIELQGGYQVAVVGGGNKISIRSVKTGDRSGSMWVIEDGLKPGETVVAEGLQRVRPNVVVNPRPFVSSPTGPPLQESIEVEALPRVEP